MFNATKAIEKQDEIFSGRHSSNVFFGELRDILTAGIEESTPHTHNLEEYRLMNARIGVIESKCGCKLKFKDDVMRRLTELENIADRVSELESKSTCDDCPEVCKATHPRKECSIKPETITIRRDLAEKWGELCKNWACDMHSKYCGELAKELKSALKK